MSFETIFTLAGDLIVVDAIVTGRRSSAPRRFVLDTGAALTTIGHDLADAIGYSARDAQRRSRVRTAVGEEHGYTLQVAELSALGVAMPSCLVNVFDLGYDIDACSG
jgi:predicted aspartyl protease